MVTISDVSLAVEEFSSRFTEIAAFSVERSDLYELSRSAVGIGWPDPWPHLNERGIYAILHKEQILYIGKASQQAIGKRLSHYFRYGSNGECVTNPAHKWSLDPTHVVTWKVPEEQFYEASALEEFLIHRFARELKDNTAGKKS